MQIKSTMPVTPRLPAPRQPATALLSAPPLSILENRSAPHPHRALHARERVRRSQSIVEPRILRRDTAKKSPLAQMESRPVPGRFPNPPPREPTRIRGRHHALDQSDPAIRHDPTQFDTRAPPRPPPIPPTVPTFQTNPRPCHTLSSSVPIGVIGGPFPSSFAPRTLPYPPTRAPGPQRPKPH
jgi:hypothetical protein